MDPFLSCYKKKTKFFFRQLSSLWILLKKNFVLDGILELVTLIVCKTSLVVKLVVKCCMSFACGPSKLRACKLQGKNSKNIWFFNTRFFNSIEASTNPNKFSVYKFQHCNLQTHAWISTWLNLQFVWFWLKLETLKTGVEETIIN